VPAGKPESVSLGGEISTASVGRLISKRYIYTGQIADCRTGGGQGITVHDDGKPREDSQLPFIRLPLPRSLFLSPSISFFFKQSEELRQDALEN